MLTVVLGSAASRAWRGQSPPWPCGLHCRLVVEGLRKGRVGPSPGGHNNSLKWGPGSPGTPSCFYQCAEHTDPTLSLWYIAHQTSATILLFRVQCSAP